MKNLIQKIKNYWNRKEPKEVLGIGAMNYVPKDLKKYIKLTKDKD